MTYYRAKQLTFSGGRALIEPLAKTWGEDFSFKPSAGHQQREDRLFHKISEKRFKNKFWIVPGSFWQEARRLCGAEKVAKVQNCWKMKKVLVCPPRQNCGRETLPLNLLERQNRGDKNWPQKETSFSFKARRCSEAANFHLVNKENTRYKKGFKTLKKVLSYNRQAWSREDLYHGTLKDKPRFFLQRNFQQLLKKELLTQASTRH